MFCSSLATHSISLALEVHVYSTQQTAFSYAFVQGTSNIPLSGCSCCEPKENGAESDELHDGSGRLVEKMRQVLKECVGDCGGGSR
jgi:hypothetical protein